ncbi:MAG: DUF2520 domain-containing protein [Myxococcota bacterium]
MQVVIIGRGRVGVGMRRFLPSAILVPGRGPYELGDVYVLAVPDAAIEATAQRINASQGAVLLHCAGSLGVDAYGSYGARETRPALGALHPLISFPPADTEATPTALDGGPYAFAVTGEGRAAQAARELVEAMGGVLLEDVHGGAYHAAAALLANGAASLADAALAILTRAGLDEADARTALAGLLQSVALNVHGIGLPGALTGPIVRGDADAVARHQRALSADETRAYNLAARSILDAARRAGLSHEDAASIEALVVRARGTP